MDPVLPADVPPNRVIAVGAFYSIERAEALSGAGVMPVIAPPAHTVVHGEERTRWHAKVCARRSRRRSHASNVALASVWFRSSLHRRKAKA
jgi:hypothetical protein